MAGEQKDFVHWKGEAVTVFYPGGQIYADYGTLEEVTDWGVVLRSRRSISWAPPGAVEGQAERDVREVSEFRPWSVISGIRLLEPEEKESHGL